MSQENEKKGGLFERADAGSSPKIKPAFDEDVWEDDVTAEDAEASSEAPVEAEAVSEEKDPTEIVNERLRERSFEIAEGEDEDDEKDENKNDTASTDVTAEPEASEETAEDAIDAIAAEVDAKTSASVPEEDADSEDLESDEKSEDEGDSASTDAPEPQGEAVEASAESKLAAEIDEVFAAKGEADTDEAAKPEEAAVSETEPDATQDESAEDDQSEAEELEETALEISDEKSEDEAKAEPAVETAEAEQATEAEAPKEVRSEASAPGPDGGETAETTPEAAEAEASESAQAAEKQPEAPKKKAKANKRRVAPKVKIIGTVIAVLAIIYAAFAVYYHYHFFPNTAINGLAASGKTVSDISSSLENRADTYSVALKGRKGETEKITATALGLSYQGKSRVKRILADQNSLAWPVHLFSKTENHSAIAYDKDKVDYLVRHLFQVSGSQVEAARNAQPVYKNGKIVIEDQIPGSTVDQTKLKKLIIGAIKTGDSTIDLKAENCYVQPKYTANSPKVKQAAAKMRKMLKAEITYTFGSDKVVIDKSVFGPWLTVDDNMNVQIDQTQLKQYLYDLAYKTNTYYGKHTFKTTGGSTITVNGGNYGWRIDRDAEAKNLTQEIEAGKVITRDPEYSKKGKVRNSTYDDIGDSYVEVSIGAQHMWVYKDGKKVVDTAVVTGDVTKGNGTTPGAYYIAYKERHATLKGQGYSTPVSYWMPFNGGQGIHDSYWRGAYGGSIYRGNGSHGCVNTPPAQVAIVWNNVSQGTPVIVY